MRALTGAAACLLIGGVTAAARPDSGRATRTGAHGPRCTPSLGHLLSADTQAAIYEVPEEAEIFGCIFGSRKSYFLGPPPFGTSSGAGGVYLATLTGPIVAYEHADIRETIKQWLVVVRDLRTGHFRRRLPTGVATKPEPFVTGIGPITSLVVKPDAAVAWIVNTNEENGGYQVHAADKTGPRVLATGADIAPGSLALAGSTLYWTQGGRPFSGVLR